MSECSPFKIERPPLNMRMPSYIRVSIWVDERDHLSAKGGNWWLGGREGKTGVLAFH